MIALTLRNYLSRFGWEIAAFWVLSISNTFLLDRNGPPGTLRAMAVLEIVALAWVTVRLVLAEDGFKTSGGWQTRPFSHKIRLGLPLGLAVAVVVFPAVVRALVYQRLFEGAALWSDFGPGSWWRQLAGWFLFFALPLKLFGMMILQRIDGRARTAAWAALALILLPLLAAFSADFGKRYRSLNSGGRSDSRELMQGIQHELPDATDFIGKWNEPIPTYLDELPAAKMLAKFFIDTDSPPTRTFLLSATASLRGSRVKVRIRGLVNDEALVGRLENATAILRYADGTCATCPTQSVSRPGKPLPFFPARVWEFSGDFISPLSLPEFDGDPTRLTRGLELMFFARDWDSPQMSVDPVRIRESDRTPFSFSPQSMKELFTQFPWPEDMWKATALPYLKKHAIHEDIPFLLDRLREDTRMADLFIDLGWTAEAMPVLRDLANERIPMGAGAIVALAAEKDPALAEDLAAIALQLSKGLDEVAPLLRAQPDFDWPGFAKELWRRRKYSTNWLQPFGEFWQPALWAAQEGDFTAFRQTAEQAANGKKWQREHLTDLVAGDHEDLIGYLRENIDQMKFDPETRKWR